MGTYEESRIATAVKTVTDALKNDEDFFESYRANIAVTFQDHYHRARAKKPGYLNRNDIHRVSNEAAGAFLTRWIG